MAGADDQPSTVVRQRTSRGFVPPEIAELLVPPLQFGGWCGAAGTVTGAGAAILHGANPLIGGPATGFYWATIGSGYWFSRIVAIRVLGGEQQLTPVDKVKASFVAGLPAGALAGLGRKSKNVLPSMVICALLAGGGQVAVNYFTRRKGKDSAEDGSWLGSRWSPLKKLTDEDYVHMMEEKILGVDADVALIDERIAKLRLQDQDKSG